MVARTTTPTTMATQVGNMFPRVVELGINWNRVSFARRVWD